MQETKLTILPSGLFCNWKVFGSNFDRGNEAYSYG